jgi:hypothetical protein
LDVYGKYEEDIKDDKDIKDGSTNWGDIALGGAVTAAGVAITATGVVAGVVTVIVEIGAGPHTGLLSVIAIPHTIQAYSFVVASGVGITAKGISMMSNALNVSEGK